jgi:hypothetical protein
VRPFLDRTGVIEYEEEDKEDSDEEEEKATVERETEGGSEAKQRTCHKKISKLGKLGHSGSQSASKLVRAKMQKGEKPPRTRMDASSA